MRFWLVWAVCLALAGCKSGPEVDPETSLRLREIRNLGKAFYENPGSANLAVEELLKGVELAPGSPRERLNYGLALLRAGERETGLAQIELAQAADPAIPHTYFNLGVEYKKAGEAERAIEQFEKMAELTPREAKVHYNLGQLYKQLDRADDAIAKFELTSELDPSLAAAHFQLFNIFRRTDRERAQVELAEFKRIKAIQDETDTSEDVNWSFYSEIYDPVEPGPLAEVAESTVFESSVIASLGEDERAGLLVFDVDADGRPDVLAWNREGAALAVNQDGSFEERGRLLGANGFGAGDANNDDYPDLCVASSEGAYVLVNREGVFPDPPSLEGSDFAGCLFSDADHDGDLDVFFLGKRSEFWRNAGGEGRFEEAEFPFENKPALAAAAVELYEDDGIDLVIAYEDEVVVYEDRKLGRYDKDLSLAIAAGSTQARLDVIDHDNDGYLDVVLRMASGEAQVLQNRGGRLEVGPTLPGTLVWADTQNRGRAEAVSASNVQGLATMTRVAAADFNGDGLIDLAGVDDAGAVQLALNRTVVSNSYASIELTGVKSAKLARGARVEVKSGPLYRKQVYVGVPLTFGLGGRNTIDTVRITWPNGLIQNEIQQPANQALSFEEKPRLSGSCPMIFTFNGNEFEYISEVLGVAPLGASLGGGRFFPVDHDEHVWIRGEQLVEQDGSFDVRITEELREVAYVDEVKLLAVDHPADLEIYTNEKAKAPPFPEFKLFGVDQKIRPTRASDHHGRDVLTRVSARDEIYADTFKRTYRNTAELHSLTLDFAGAPEQVRLFLHGWVDWSSASVIVGASQTKDRALAPPILQVRNASGDWETVVNDLGLPGGRSRTISLDVKFPGESREVRIVTNMCLYWDEVFAAVDSENPEARVTEVSAASAELRFRGFSRNITYPGRRQPESFVYADVSPVSTWNPTPGLYTRFGNVSPLLETEDDRLVVMGAGDEIALRFPARSLPQLKPGWRRDFILKVDGWAKEREANTAFGDAVEPLPFHQMSGYPYTSNERFPGLPKFRDEFLTRPALKLIRPLYPPR